MEGGVLRFVVVVVEVSVAIEDLRVVFPQPHRGHHHALFVNLRDVVRARVLINIVVGCESDRYKAVLEDFSRDVLSEHVRAVVFAIHLLDHQSSRVN